MSFKEIPVVNVSRLYSNDLNERKAVSEEIGDAAKNVGFLYVSGHQVDPKLIEETRQLAKEFFALPSATKMEYHIGSNGFHNGYVAEGDEVFDDNEVPDYKEAFDYGLDVPADHPLVKAGNLLVGPVNWPTKEIPRFAEIANKYRDEIMELGARLLRSFCLSLGLDENYFDKYTKNPPSVLRFVHYWGGKQDRVGIAEHSDYEFFTILLVDAPGLQVKNDLGEWIDAPPIPGTFIVNIGDMLQHLTGGQLKATRHRVLNVPCDRYSFPLFYTCDYETEITPVTGGESMRMGDHVMELLGQTYKYLHKDTEASETPSAPMAPAVAIADASAA